MTLISNNVLIVGQPRTQQTPNPMWLRLRDDPRPACALVLGDGFTQDFLGVFGLSELIRCGIPNHFSHNGSLYVPVADDPLPEQPLWNRELWPRLTKAWDDFDRKDPRAFYESLAKTPFNPDRKRGLWTFDTQSIAYEVRCYLWHLFRYFHFTAGARLNAQFATPASATIFWPWGQLLHLLLAEFRLDVVSFNYDLFFEMGMSLLSRNSVPTLQAVRDADFTDAPANQVIVRKIHGSVHYILRTPLELLTESIYRGPHPWKVPMRFENNLVSGVETHIDASGELKSFPFIPDIVPPGHPGDDICNPISFALDRAREQLSNSKLIIFCGLSGNPPDTEEVRSLVRSMRSDSTVIHVGRKSDRSGCLASLLHEAGFRTRHFISTEDNLFATVLEILKGSFALKYAWRVADSPA